jgi:glycerol 3-phosphatase-2
VALSSLVAGYDALMLDLDGCVYVGEEATPGAPEAIEALRTEGKGVVFVTNDSRHAVEDYVQKLWRLGVRAAVADVVSVGAAVQHLLAQTLPGRGAFVIGTEAFRRHVADAGLVLLNGRPEADHADVVIVAGPDELSYDDLRSATLSVRAGADFIATGRDSTYPMPDGLWPGTGAILAAVEYATDRRAEIVGKPEPGLFRIALDRLGPGRVLAVGDRLDADVAAAERAGLDAALVLTGATSAEEAERAEEPRPVVVATSLGALVGV